MVITSLVESVSTCNWRSEPTLENISGVIGLISEGVKVECKAVCDAGWIKILVATDFTVALGIIDCLFDSLCTNDVGVNLREFGFGANLAIEGTFSLCSHCAGDSIDCGSYGAVEAMSGDGEVLPTCKISFLLADAEDDWDSFDFIALGPINIWTMCVEKWLLDGITCLPLHANSLLNSWISTSFNSSRRTTS